MSPRLRRTPRYRRRIFTIGMLIALLVFSIGFPIFNNRIEADLERRVPAELAAAGFPGITASFSGQDGTLRCAEPLDDPERATAVAYDVRGVREITLDRLCRVNRAPTVGAPDADDTATTPTDGTDDGSETATTPDFESILDAVADDPELSFLRTLLDDSGTSSSLADPTSEPVTLFAPTDDAFDALPADAAALLRSDSDLLAAVLAHHVASGAIAAADLPSGTLTMLDGSPVTVARDGGVATVDDAQILRPDVRTANGVVHVVDTVLLPAGFDAVLAERAAVTATLQTGAVTLTGVVATEVERVALVAAATAAVGEGAVVDELTVDPDTGLDGELAQGLASLIAAMPDALSSGTAGFDGTALYVDGVALDAAAAERLVAAADAVDAVAVVDTPPVADPEEAQQLEDDLNETVAANPIRFEPNSAVLTTDAAAVLDELAEQVLEVEGVSITVEGHTDSDGDAIANQILSRQRAEAVRTALVERGVDETTITAEGFGEDRPVRVNGVEDKDASRRVEFRIETAG
jgi:outer membrane protein OmpA-like peptidoglycan-associated protein/uncharacterized surface protein with fasciclin (FAS1) repeats